MEEVSFFQNSSSRPADIRCSVSICTTTTYFESQYSFNESVWSVSCHSLFDTFTIESTQTLPMNVHVGISAWFIARGDNSLHFSASIRVWTCQQAGCVRDPKPLNLIRVRQILQNKSELFSGIDYVNMFTICFIILGLLWTYLDIPCHCYRSGSWLKFQWTSFLSGACFC